MPSASLLDGQIAIVTGGGRGVGRGEALALAGAGAAVAVLGTTTGAVEKVAAEIEEAGGRALALTTDVTRRDQVDEAVRRTHERFGRVDVLVNNAQRIPVPHPFEEWTQDELRTVWESGFLGTWNLMQACFPIMKAQGHGRIVNTCSNVGYSNWPGFSGYAATKEAIRALTRTTAAEWGPLGITVNVISPASLGPSMAETFSDEQKEAMMQMIPLRRYGDAEADIGRAVVYLAGDGGYVTGCTLSVDGGMQMVV
jgi:NAD(P)-dependent dehydrogenase (short-subunit alcohol dehydrogenase family)